MAKAMTFQTHRDLNFRHSCSLLLLMINSQKGKLKHHTLLQCATSLLFCLGCITSTTSKIWTEILKIAKVTKTMGMRREETSVVNTKTCLYCNILDTNLIFAYTFSIL